MLERESRRGGCKRVLKGKGEGMLENYLIKPSRWGGRLATFETGRDEMINRKGISLGQKETHKKKKKER